MMKDGRLAHVCRTPRTLLIGVAASLCMVGAAPAQTVAAEPTQSEPATAKPNIVVIWGDDIGQSNVSAYSTGVMGYGRRISTASPRRHDVHRLLRRAKLHRRPGRRSSPASAGFRTGLTKVGLPGATLGLRKEDPTIAELLKPLGYATGQFGKNHLGDRNEFLPTVHGFDEFYGNLYHLNAEEEPELPDYPKDPAFRAKFGPRGVMDCKASDKDDPTVDPRFGKVGKQVCKDTGPLTKKRMETIDDDIADRAVDFIQRQDKAGKPVFVWVNFTHMHFRTHAKPESIGQAGQLPEPLSRHHDRSRQERRHRAQGARRSRHRRQHLRHVLDRQRPAHELMARRGDDTIPQREELELGRRLPGAGHGALAGQDQAGPGLQRNCLPSRLAADAGGGRRRRRCERQAAQGLQGRRHDLQGPSRRRQPRALPDRAGGEEPAGSRSSTSTTTSN